MLNRLYLPIPMIFLPYRFFIGKIIPTYLKTKMFGILKTNQPCIIIGIDICYHPSFGTGICIGETHQPCSRVEKSGKYAPRNTQAKKLSKSHLKYVLVLLLWANFLCKWLHLKILHSDTCIIVL